MFAGKIHVLTIGAVTCTFTQPTVVGSVRKTPMVAQRSNALKGWSVLMCQLLVWEQSVEPVLLDIVEMEKSALVSCNMHISAISEDLLFPYSSFRC